MRAFFCFSILNVRPHTVADRHARLAHAAFRPCAASPRNFGGSRLAPRVQAGNGLGTVPRPRSCTRGERQPLRCVGKSRLSGILPLPQIPKSGLVLCWGHVQAHKDGSISATRCRAGLAGSLYPSGRWPVGARERVVLKNTDRHARERRLELRQLRATWLSVPLQVRPRSFRVARSKLADYGSERPSAENGERRGHVVGATGPLLADASIPMRAICGDGVEHLSTHLRAPGQRARCKQRHALRT